MKYNEKLPPELKATWLEALRSGNYQQGKKKLRDWDNKFCCLGVLCDVMGVQWEQDPDGVYMADGKRAFLPYGILAELNIDDARFWDLSVKNDEGMPFEEIADIIQEQF